jgi:hypothetical protein
MEAAKIIKQAKITNRLIHSAKSWLQDLSHIKHDDKNP